MYVIDCTNIEGVVVPAPFERYIKVIVAPDIQQEIQDISITMGIIAPHSQNDMHLHEEGAELLYIATGYGKAIVGDETCVIKENSLIIAPKGVWHQQINESDETMRMLAIWTPAVTGKEVLERAFAAAKR